MLYSKKIRQKVILDNQGEKKKLAFTIVGGSDSPNGAMGIYVKTIYPGGLADECGQLHSGDEILSVNGTSLQSMTHKEALSTIKKHKSHLPMTLLICKKLSLRRHTSLPSSSLEPIWTIPEESVTSQAIMEDMDNPPFTPTKSGTDNKDEDVQPMADDLKLKCPDDSDDKKEVSESLDFPDQPEQPPWSEGSCHGDDLTHHKVSLDISTKRGSSSANEDISSNKEDCDLRERFLGEKFEDDFAENLQECRMSESDLKLGIATSAPIFCEKVFPESLEIPLDAEIEKFDSESGTFLKDVVTRVEEFSDDETSDEGIAGSRYSASSRHETDEKSNWKRRREQEDASCSDVFEDSFDSYSSPVDGNKNNVTNLLTPIGVKISTSSDRDQNVFLNNDTKHEEATSRVQRTTASTQFKDNKSTTACQTNTISLEVTPCTETYVHPRYPAFLEPTRHRNNKEIQTIEEPARRNKEKFRELSSQGSLNVFQFIPDTQVYPFQRRNINLMQTLESNHSNRHHISEIDNFQYRELPVLFLSPNRPASTVMGRQPLQHSRATMNREQLGDATEFHLFPFHAARDKQNRTQQNSTTLNYNNAHDRKLFGTLRSLEEPVFLEKKCSRRAELLNKYRKRHEHWNDSRQTCMEALKWRLSRSSTSLNQLSSWTHDY